jgi:outer membrane protein assembly factor BamB/predicted negative regulator of RcsB-dependent stress response
MGCGKLRALKGLLAVATLLGSSYLGSLLHLLPGVAPALVLAQDKAADDSEQNVFFPADRESLHRLSTAQTLLREKRYGEAVRFLGSILEGPEDYFFRPDKGEQSYRSLKTEAQNLIGQMPADGRQSYELQFGARAQKMLDEAAKAGDAVKLAEISRRFFHTKAGYEATELLGTYDMEHGHPLAAALCFKRLQDSPAAARRFEPLLTVKMAVCWSRAGMTPQANEALAKLKQRMPDAQVTLAGRARALFADKGPASWLQKVLATPTSPALPGHAASGEDSWTMFRGNPARNGLSDGGSPLLNRRWSVPTTNDDPQIDKLLEQLREAYVDQGVAVLPACHPLAVREFVFFRTVAGLMAVDFRTGKRIWTGHNDDAVEQLLEPSADDNPLGDSTSVSNWLDQRVWEDSTYGTLSSDGESVFCIEDLGSSPVAEQRMVLIFNGNNRGQIGGTRSYNRLAAYDIASEGKLKWELGGPASEPRGELAGAFFLGAPLPLAGRLYALAEIKGEIRLLALDAKTGALDWSQQLAVLERSILDDPMRRVAGVSPSYSDGVLVCPTSAGAVVAVDLTTRSLLWGYQYSRATELVMPHNRIRAFNIVGASATNEAQRWCDASVTIAEGRVLLTPIESTESPDVHTELHCLNLVDGKLLWKRPREEGLYVACVDAGTALVVGRTHLRSYRLADGSSGWPQETMPLPSGSLPSGRGFFNGERYYLPLNSAEVAAVDFKTGAIVNRSKSRTGSICGNLICYQGSVVSQGVNRLECFYQLDDLRRRVAETLQKQPEDPTALALRGELLLDDGKLDQAVSEFRHSFERRTDPRTRQLLIEALVDGLRRDFPSHRRDIPEIERLIEQSTQRLDYLRTLATGLQTAGEYLPAFETYLKIMGLPASGADLERVDNSLAVRRDRWVQARLKVLGELAGKDDRAAMDKVLHERLELATKAAGIEQLESFVNYFGSDPLADVARERILNRQEGTATPLEAEQLLRHLQRSNDSRLANSAVARIARLLAKTPREDEATPYYERLAGPLADVVCLDGKTGSQLLAELPATATTEAKSKDFDPFPSGQVKKEPVEGETSSSYRSAAIDLRGPRGPFLSRYTVELDQSNQQKHSLVGRDGMGRERWRVSLNERNDRPIYGYQSSLAHGRIDGHFLLVSLGFQLVAIDTLGKPGKEGPRVLWREELTEAVPGMARNAGLQGKPAPMAIGPPRFIATDAYMRPVGNTGPTTLDSVCFQRQRNLLAVDPLTGRALWTRSNVQPGSDIFGDEELLFVTPPNSSEAVVLRALDGQEVGRRAVPPLEHRVVTLGRKIVTWAMVDGKSVLKMRDIWAEQDQWERKYPTSAKPWPFESQAVAVLDRQGHLEIVSLPDGKVDAAAEVSPEPQLTEIYMFRTPTRDLIVTNRPWRNTDNNGIQPVPGGLGNPLINGHVHGLDRKSGKIVYSTPVENRSLTFNQPIDLPVLTFASQIYRHNRTFNNEPLQQTALLCLDKRNGHIIYDEQSTGPITTIEMIGSPEKQQVLLKTIRTAIRMTFTDTAYPPPKVEKTPFSSRAGKAITRGMQRWLESFTPQPESMGRFPPQP